MASVGVLIRKYWRLTVFILWLIFICCLLWVLRNVFLAFVVGFILAYLLLPIIRWVEKRLPGTNNKPKLKQLIRISTILAVYLLALAVVGLLVFYTVTLIGKNLGTVTQDISKVIPDGLDKIKLWLKTIPLLSSPSMQANIDAYTAKAQAALPGVLQGFLTNGVKIFQSSGSLILGFTSLPVFIFFLLKDWGGLRDKFYAGLPPWTRIHTKGIFDILQNVVVRYIRAQLIRAVIVGVCFYLVLFIMKIDFALPLAVFAAVMELVPTIGPWLGFGLAVLVTLATAPEKIIWVAVGFFAIQMIEGNLIMPKIQGSQMEIHPAIILVLTVLGAYLAGILGFIIILPLAMAVIKIFKYLRDSTREGIFS